MTAVRRRGGKGGVAEERLYQVKNKWKLSYSCIHRPGGGDRDSWSGYLSSHYYHNSQQDRRMSVCLPACPSVCLSACLPVCLYFEYPSIHALVLGKVPILKHGKATSGCFMTTTPSSSLSQPSTISTVVYCIAVLLYTSTSYSSVHHKRRDTTRDSRHAFFSVFLFLLFCEYL